MYKLIIKVRLDKFKFICKRFRKKRIKRNGKLIYTLKEPTNRLTPHLF